MELWLRKNHQLFSVNASFSILHTNQLPKQVVVWQIASNWRIFDFGFNWHSKITICKIVNLRFSIMNHFDEFLKRQSYWIMNFMGSNKKNICNKITVYNSVISSLRTMYKLSIIFYFISLRIALFYISNIIYHRYESWSVAISTRMTIGIYLEANNSFGRRL